MTLAPRQRRHTKTPANSKLPSIADEEIEDLEESVVLLDSPTSLKTPDAAAKTMALGVPPQLITTLETPDVAAETMTLTPDVVAETMTK